MDRLELDTRHKSIQQPPPPKQTNKILPIQPVNNLADIRGLKTNKIPKIAYHEENNYNHNHNHNHNYDQ